MGLAEAWVLGEVGSQRRAGATAMVGPAEREQLDAWQTHATAQTPRISHYMLAVTLYCRDCYCSHLEIKKLRHREDKICPK